MLVIRTEIRGTVAPLISRFASRTRFLRSFFRQLAEHTAEREREREREQNDHGATLSLIFPSSPQTLLQSIYLLRVTCADFSSKF